MAQVHSRSISASAWALNSPLTVASFVLGALATLCGCHDAGAASDAAALSVSDVGVSAGCCSNIGSDRTVDVTDWCAGNNATPNDDSSGDDARAMQDAIACLQVAETGTDRVGSVGTVRIPPGIYHLDRGITVETGPSGERFIGVRILGAGPTQTLLINRSADATFTVSDDERAASFELAQMALWQVRHGASPATAAVRAFKVRHSHIHDLHLFHQGHGIHMTGALAGTVVERVAIWPGDSFASWSALEELHHDSGVGPIDLELPDGLAPARAEAERGFWIEADGSPGSNLVGGPSIRDITVDAGDIGVLIERSGPEVGAGGVAVRGGYIQFVDTAVHVRGLASPRVITGVSLRDLRIENVEGSQAVWAENADYFIMERVSVGGSQRDLRLHDCSRVSVRDSTGWETLDFGTEASARSTWLVAENFHYSDLGSVPTATDVMLRKVMLNSGPTTGQGIRTPGALVGRAVGAFRAVTCAGAATCAGNQAVASTVMVDFDSDAVAESGVDVDGAFDTTTNYFTAPRSGVYQLGAQLQFKPDVGDQRVLGSLYLADNPASGAEPRCQLSYQNGYYEGHISTYGMIFSGTCMLPLAQGEQVRVIFTAGEPGTIMAGPTKTAFWGHFVGLCGTEGLSSVICSNGVDDDCDGLIDASDPDCSAFYP